VWRPKPIFFLRLAHFFQISKIFLRFVKPISVSKKKTLNLKVSKIMDLWKVVKKSDAFHFFASEYQITRLFLKN
jgi:hypothetical protein